MSRQSLPPLHPRASRALAALALLAIAACSGVEVMGTAGARGGGTGVLGGGGGGGSTSSALVGRWVRTIVLQTSDGDIYQSRTEWEFRSDGSAVRVVTSGTVASGVYDTVTAAAEWRTNGSSLTISYLPPATGTATFQWSIVGDTLTIGSDQYTRAR